MKEVVYESVFRQEFEELVRLKRASGFSYETEALAFKRLDKFFIQNGMKKKILSKEICDHWCLKRSHESLTNHSSRICVLRVFCKYLVSLGMEAYVPPKGLSHPRSKYDAHIYTDDELKRFFAAVDKSQSVPLECPYRALTMPVFFRILYTSGLRVSELRHLRVSDFNLDKGYITVRNGKNNKDRIVPIHPELVKRCQGIKTTIHANSDENEFFFMLRPNREMSLSNVYKNFRRYLEQAGITHTGKGPRIHDFRHTFCVNLLRKWTDEGKDLMAYLPYMRTILGHESFKETAYYLKLTAERFPYIKDALKKSFPDIISEEINDETEFH